MGKAREPARPWRRLAQACLIGLAVLFAAPSAGIRPSWAALPARVEAETFVSSHDLGGASISVQSCPTASGGLVVTGMDGDGEWIECPVAISGPDSFFVALRSAASVGLVRRWTLGFLTEQEPPVLLFMDTLVTVPGGGVG